MRYSTSPAGTPKGVPSTSFMLQVSRWDATAETWEHDGPPQIVPNFEYAQHQALGIFPRQSNPAAYWDIDGQSPRYMVTVEHYAQVILTRLTGPTTSAPVVTVLKRASKGLQKGDHVIRFEGKPVAIWRQRPGGDGHRVITRYSSHITPEEIEWFNSWQFSQFPGTETLESRERPEVMRTQTETEGITAEALAKGQEPA